jgi:hypothetical protein
MILLSCHFFEVVKLKEQRETGNRKQPQTWHQSSAMLFWVSAFVETFFPEDLCEILVNGGFFQC